MNEVFSVRIPRELKMKMKKYNVNWRECIIEAIEDKLKQLEAEEMLKEIDRMNEGLEPARTPSWKMIREDRENDSR